MRLTRLIAPVVLALACGLANAADKPPESWDGLVAVKSKRMDMAYVAPGADFKSYDKLMIDPTQVSFHKDWMKDINNDRRDLSRKIDEGHANEVLEAAKTNFADVFGEAFSKGGYTIVTAPGPGVLRVTPGLTNLYINAPDVMAPGRSTSYTANAGEATLVLELRDSQTNALLGRVLDRRETRESTGMQMSNRVTNTQDFRMLFKSWATSCVKGLDTLKSLSPLPQSLTPGQKLD